MKLGAGHLALYQYQVLEHLYVRIPDYFTNIEDLAGRCLHGETLAALRSGDTAEMMRAIDIHLKPLEDALVGCK